MMINRVPNFDTSVAAFASVGSKIHVSYLFANKCSNILKNLRTAFISSPMEEDLQTCWRRFAVELGYDNQMIECIENELAGKNNKEPIWWVLLGYTMFNGATLDKIMDALLTLNRTDVLMEVLDELKEIAEHILHVRDSDDTDCNIYRYENLPDIPDLLSIAVKVCISNSQRNEQIEQQKPEDNTEGATSGIKVLLTYATDGRELAERVSAKFASRGIHVINLEKDRPCYWTPIEFVVYCIQKVNYVIPILTQGYLRATVTHSVDDFNASPKGLYTRYIYCSLLKDYQVKGCKNDRVRCIVLDKDEAAFKKIHLTPILDLRYPESLIKKMIRLILRDEI